VEYLSKCTRETIAASVVQSFMYCDFQPFGGISVDEVLTKGWGVSFQFRDDMSVDALEIDLGMKWPPWLAVVAGAGGDAGAGLSSGARIVIYAILIVYLLFRTNSHTHTQHTLRAVWFSKATTTDGIWDPAYTSNGNPASI